MASIEFITKRIESAQKNITKLEKKLERIRKVESQNWEDPNPYCYSASDLKYCLRDLDEARFSLQKYQAQLEVENQKADARNIPVIVEFLNHWKDRNYDYYLNAEYGLVAYYAEEKKVKDLYQAVDDHYYGLEKSAERIAFEEAQKSFQCKRRGYFELRDYTDRWGKKRSGEVKIRDGEYEWLYPYAYARTLEEACEKLLKDLEQEWNRKYDFIVERTVEITGTITDASNLCIGAKGDLNGYIIGTDGTAKVQTIGAGGYAVQRFHFRTLINRMK